MKWIPVLLIAVYAVACSGANEDDAVVQNNDTVNFYPIRDFVEEQIADLKRTPYVVNKYTIEGNKQDSAMIDTTEYIRLAKEFITPDITAAGIKKYYKETVFEDHSTGSYVLNYTTEKPDLPIRNVNVMLNNQDQKLKRIDIMKAYARNDSSFEERLAWLPNQSFQIVRIVSKDGAETVRQSNVVWGDRNPYRQ